jgi:amino acid transporter
MPAPALNWIVSIAALVIFAGFYVLIERHATRPADPLKPRLVPWRLVQILCGLAAFLALVHMVNLLGIRTGGQIMDRYGGR